MVPIPKRKREYQGIGLVEVSLKVCAAVVIFRLKQGVVLHNALHRFREGHRMGTSTLEANMDQQLSGITHEPLLQFFIYVRKAYDSLDGRKVFVSLEGVWVRSGSGPPPH